MSRNEVIKAFRTFGVGFLFISILFFGYKSLGYKPIVVISNSMEPVHLTNSIVLIDTKTEFKDLEVGDVIQYKHKEHQGIVHRVFQKGNNSLLTSGINRESNPIIDSWVVSEEMYVGKVVKGFNGVAPVIWFLFGNLVDKNPTHILFGFSILLLVVVALILSILKLKIFIKKRRCLKMREIATDVYVKTEYRKNNSKPKVKFQAVIGKVLVSAIVLSTIISGAASMPVYASTGNDNSFNATVSYNYEISVENTIFQVKQTIKLIEEMKSTGLVTNEVLSKLASQLMELEKAVQISGKAVTQDIEDVIIEVENVINGVKGSETVDAVLRVTKKSLNISGSIEVINIKQAKAVQLSDIGTHWGKANIERLVDLNAISGYPDGTFKPNNTISFAEFLKIAVSSVEKDIKQAPSGSHWASGVYQTAIEKEIIQPHEFEGTKEQFDSTISREDMALILVRLNEVSKGNNQVDTSNTKGMIQDHSKIASNRTYFVEQAFQKGLLKGKGNGFDPKGNLTRAEAATAIVNLLDYKEGTVVETPIQNTENRQPMTIRQDDPNRPMAIAGDTFVKADGTKVVLKVGPSGILGELQGVATELGRVDERGSAIKHKSLGIADEVLGQPYLVDSKTGEGHYQREWDSISTYYRTNILPKVENPKDGQIVDNWFYFEGGTWYWIGASQNSK